MNYYKHHIGDYDSATAHLSMMEDGAYRRLISLYYRKEQLIPLDVVQACRLVRAVSDQERESVIAVLREFFTETPDGWRHSRCDKEIAEAAEIADRNRNNGKSGGRPRRIGNPSETQGKPSGLFLGSQNEPKPNPDLTHDTGAPLSSGNLSHKPLATSHEEAKELPSSTAEKPGEEPDLIWSHGLAWMKRKGVADGKARGTIGLAIKETDRLTVATLLQQAEADDVVEPVAWLLAAVKHRKSNVAQLSLVPSAPEPVKASHQPLRHTPRG